jgi:hypothetical protein
MYVIEGLLVLRVIVMTEVTIRRKARKIINESEALAFAKSVKAASIPLNTKPKGLLVMQDKKEEQ